MEYLTIGGIIFLVFTAAASAMFLIKSKRSNDKMIKDKKQKEINTNPISDERLRERYRKEINSQKRA